MKTIMAIALTVCCWGIYGPVLHQGQHAMDGSRLRPFLCVGISYFFIAIVAASVFLWIKGEKGQWTASGIVWSLISGAAGALGALGIIMALTFGGAPIYVMPIVFGGAPVINSFVTIVLAKTFKQISPLFYAGLIVVVAGAVVVMVFKPAPLVKGGHGKVETQLFWVIASTMLTVLSWGTYGAVLHKGQAKMHGSRLRPYMEAEAREIALKLRVALAALGAGWEASGGFDFSGVVWSLAGGCAGALGALGIILAFTTGGKPVYVMPLVFSGAPVVNTFVTLATQKSEPPSELFYAGLILVVVGAVVVLAFAPKGKPPVSRSADTVEMTTKTIIAD
ncbi:MAG: hypothetical protein KDA42_10230 [Planctomycetales bacterium]|nr:hypothetical protein [Planctomycetales bacterium]